MMQYVYGPLKNEMSAIHSLNHLIHDDISKVLSPTTFAHLGRDHENDKEDEEDEDPHFLSNSRSQ
jgi:hypothetical protein